MKSVRNGNTVRQEIVAYLGALNAKGKAKAQASARQLGLKPDQPELFDPLLQDKIVPVQIKGVALERARQFGNVYLGMKLWQIHEIKIAFRDSVLDRKRKLIRFYLPQNDKEKRVDKILEQESEIEKLRNENDSLREENERIKKPPPSKFPPQKQSTHRSKPPSQWGRKPGHKGTTRPKPDPIGREVEQTLKVGPECEHKLGAPIESVEAIHEDIVPAHVEVTRYIHHPDSFRKPEKKITRILGDALRLDQRRKKMSRPVFQRKRKQIEKRFLDFAYALYADKHWRRLSKRLAKDARGLFLFPDVPGLSRDNNRPAPKRRGGFI